MRVFVWGKSSSICSQIFLFLWLRTRQRPLGWTHLCPGSPLPGPYQIWACPGDLGYRFAFFLHCSFSWEPHHTQGQTLPCDAEADKPNLSRKQVIFLQNLTKKGEGHYPWLEILSYLESNLTESPWFSSRGPKGKKRSAFFVSLVE